MLWIATGVVNSCINIGLNKNLKYFFLQMLLSQVCKKAFDLDIKVERLENRRRPSEPKIHDMVIDIKLLT